MFGITCKYKLTKVAGHNKVHCPHNASLESLW